MVSMTRSTHTERVGHYNSTAKAPGSGAYGEGGGCTVGGGVGGVVGVGWGHLRGGGGGSLLGIFSETLEISQNS